MCEKLPLYWIYLLALPITWVRAVWRALVYRKSPILNSHLKTISYVIFGITAHRIFKLAHVLHKGSADSNNREATVIIQMADYRTSEQSFSADLSDFSDVCGNTVRRRKFDARLSSPDLPDQFDDFNAKEFIDRAYGLATQI